MMQDDPVDEGDLEVARELTAATEGAELFVYPGATHLFVDDGLPDYDAEAAVRCEERVLGLLDALG